MKLEGHTILITGGTSGIGLELSEQLLSRGNVVIATGRNPEKLTRAQQLLPALVTIASDVSRAEDVESLYSRVSADFPALNVLINNAGISRWVNIASDDKGLEELTQEIDVNFTGPVRMIRRFLPLLQDKPSAAIVNVSAGLAFVPLPTMPIYSATKAALHSFTLSLRIQLATTGIKVIELLPPTTQTEMLGDISAEDVKDMSAMKTDEMVRRCLARIEAGHDEIRPGQSNQLKWMNRIAPAFILAQLGKASLRMAAARNKLKA